MRQKIKRSKHMTGQQRLESAAIRFCDNTVNVDGCWIWIGGLERKGYARFRSEKGNKVFTHRWAYELLVGPIPEGLTIDHLCRTTSCCNPAHLEPVTDIENIARGTQGDWQKRKTHCYKGHEFSALNTYVNPQGHRSCRTCQRALGRIHDAKRRAKNA